jgi:transcriptional regulator with XRE-family HTH domain
VRDPNKPKTVKPLIADRLEMLFDIFRNPDDRDSGGMKRPFTNQAIADRINTLAAAAAAAGDRDGPESITAATIGNIRRGDSPNPTRGHLLGLALAFKAPIAVFFPGKEGEDLATQLKAIRSTRDARVTNIALRAHEELAPADRELIQDQIAQLDRLVERLTPRREGSEA